MMSWKAIAYATIVSVACIVFVLRPSRTTVTQRGKTAAATRRTVSRTVDPAADAAVPAVTSVKCICGPSGAEDYALGCQAVITNAITTTHANGQLEMRFIVASEEMFVETAGAVMHCIGTPENHLRLAFNYADFKMGRAAPAEVEQCRRRGWTDELLWVVQWPMSVYYHFLFDRGVFQAWMFLRELERTLSPFPAIHVNIMTLPDDVRSRLTQAEWDIWKLMVPVDRTTILGPDTVHCSRLTTFGFWWTSPMTYRNHYRLDRALQASLSDFAMALQKRAVERYGDSVIVPNTVLHCPRKFIAEFDDQGRSRGIAPQWDTALRAVIVNATRAKIISVDFEAQKTLKRQFLEVRRHRIVYAAEGSFFVSMLFAPARSTWVMVYNHTRGQTDWKHHNFHSTIASALPFMRLVIFVINHGHVPPLSELQTQLESPWAHGVYFIGADHDGN